MKKTALVLIVISIVVILIGVGVHYFTWASKAKEFDQSFIRNSNLYKKEVSHELDKIDSLNELAKKWKLIERQIAKNKELSTELKDLQNSKIFLRKIAELPSIQLKDISINNNQIKTDISVFCNIHRSLMETVSAQFRSTINSEQMFSFEIINSVTSSHVEKLKIGKKLNYILKGLNSQTNYEIVAKICKNDLAKVNKINVCLRIVVHAKKKSLSEFKVAMDKIDIANQKLNQLGDYAESGIIYNTYESWNEAHDRLIDAKKSAISFPGLNDRKLKEIAIKLTESDVDKIDLAISKADQHRDMVYEKYSIARREESNVVSSYKRTALRGLSNLKKWGRSKMNQASNSRIGKEVKLATKTLILGSKIFYDFMGSGSSDDLFTLANKYESDIDQLMSESNEISSMDEASLTGKNTIIEDFVNSAYSQSFSK